MKRLIIITLIFLSLTIISPLTSQAQGIEIGVLGVGGFKSNYNAGAEMTGLAGGSINISYFFLSEEKNSFWGIDLYQSFFRHGFEWGYQDYVWDTYINYVAGIVKKNTILCYMVGLGYDAPNHKLPSLLPLINIMIGGSFQYLFLDNLGIKLNLIFDLLFVPAVKIEIGLIYKLGFEDYYKENVYNSLSIYEDDKKEETIPMFISVRGVLNNYAQRYENDRGYDQLSTGADLTYGIYWFSFSFGISKVISEARLNNETLMISLSVDHNSIKEVNTKIKYQ